MVDVQLRGGVVVLRLVYFCLNYGKLSRDNRGLGRLNRNVVVGVVVWYPILRLRAFACLYSVAGGHWE